jgi:hexokinase
MDNKPLSLAQQAYQIFEKEAKQRGTNYLGDLVRQNLSNLVANGYSPQDAVKELYRQAGQYIQNIVN